jgi:hypothetical protein
VKKGFFSLLENMPGWAEILLKRVFVLITKIKNYIQQKKSVEFFQYSYKYRRSES